MAVETIKVRKYKVGYHIHDQEVSGYEAGGGPSFIMKSYFTPEGLYIGDGRTARFLVVQKGIKPELARPSANVCSIGFCETEQKWYGWSHRAIAGFAVGNRIFEEDWEEATEDTPFLEHGPLPITNLDEAKQAAIGFAKSVS
jgi:hypothetical protein